MLRLVNNINAVNRKILANNARCKQELAEFVLKKLNYYTSVRTGFLLSRNKVEIKHNSVILSNDAHYSGFLEYGTRKMMAQPFMKPAVMNHVGEIRSIVAKCFREGM
jgi:HK97 gp10 family phage protein